MAIGGDVFSEGITAFLQRVVISNRGWVNSDQNDNPLQRNEAYFWRRFEGKVLLAVFPKQAYRLAI